MKKKINKIILILEKTNTGFSVYSEKYPIFTTGKTILDLIDNAFEACSLYLRIETSKFEIDFK